MTNERANQIYDFLIKETDAPENLRNDFVAAFTDKIQPCKEFRCCHSGLGAGGKFHIDALGHMWVSNYPEFSNKKIDAKMDKINEKLKRGI